MSQRTPPTGLKREALQSLSIPGAFALGALQLTDGRVLRLLVKSAFVSLVLLALVGWGGFTAFEAAFAWVADSESVWVAGLGQLVAVVAAVLSAWLVWRIIAMAVLQFYADDVVSAVEARHYPAFTPRDVPLSEEIGAALRGMARTIIVNALVLPIALALIITGVGTAVLFITVNAFLLGRELQEMAWMRHPNDGTAAPLAAGARFLLGLGVVAMLAIPVVNLLAPFLGAAAATHLVHRAATRASSQEG